MNPTIGDRFRYHFDNLMARGTPAMIGMLFVASMVIVLLAAAIISFAGIVQDSEAGQLTFAEASWDSLIRTLGLDADTVGRHSGAGYRTVMLLVSLGGVFIVSALVGVLSSGLDARIEALRKGRSRVLENNHTLILGWSPQIFAILSQLLLANQNQRNAAIVVLADKDKAEMEDEIRERVDLGQSRTKIICRNGRPIDPSDIDIVNPHGAKSIIILPPEDEDPDAKIIKVVLAITNTSRRHSEAYCISTQVREEKNLSALQMACANDRLQVVLTGDLISRLVAQTSYQSGLYVVYTELMDYEGDEIYFKEEPALVGKTYGEALLAYEDSCVMGLHKAENSAILLNPPMDTPIQPGDRIFALSEDDDTIRLAEPSSLALQTELIRSEAPRATRPPANYLFLGWNDNGASILRELDYYIAPGSRVTVVADLDEETLQSIREQGAGLSNQTLLVQQGDTTDRAVLDELAVNSYNHAVVLAYAHLGAQEADAATLVTLLHLRDIVEKTQAQISIVSEFLDLRNRELARSVRVDDFIVSEQLISLMMAQYSENPELYEVFTDIFDADGSEIYLKPAADYVQAGAAVNFYTVVEAARRRGETAIGYRILAETADAEKNFGVYTNPKKSAAITFGEADKVIVLAED
ncbi:MAG: NAD-binding protein [Anaerolineales bacterium]|nr:NAD-binding protein [Anaerolineales bacterium]